VEEWAEIHPLAPAERLSIKVIMRRTGAPQNAVRRARPGGGACGVGGSVDRGDGARAGIGDVGVFPSGVIAIAPASISIDGTACRVPELGQWS
jgi:hypothetical protein